MKVTSDKKIVPKSETRGFDSWLTSSLRIECNFPLASSDVKMMSETKLCSYATNEQNKWYGVYIKLISKGIENTFLSPDV